MEFRLLIIILAGITSTYCETKNCEAVEFCNNFRNREPTNIYSVDPKSIPIEPGTSVLTATLKASDGSPDLSLILFGIEGDIFRLKITELNSTRYELEEVLLDGAPITESFDSMELTQDYVMVTTGFSENKAKIIFSPFSIEFSKHDISEIIFNGSRLILTQNENNAPFAFGLTYPEAVQLYGLHEHCDNLALRQTHVEGTDPYRLKNSDAFFIPNTTVALYGSIPFLYAHGPRATAGTFLHNAAEEWVEITNEENGNTEAYFMVDTGTLDLFLLLGQAPKDVSRQYLSLTGTAHLPQLWTLGYHQCRYSYSTQDEVKEIISNFDSNNFQLDAIWLDIDYTDGFRYFTWNPETFSDPIGLQETIASTNKKLVTIIDPHIKVDTEYSVYANALSEDLFVKNSNGTVFEGNCWPGLSSWMDFLKPEARDYYASMYSYENFVNSTSTISGIWNDMNEPSVFDISENTLPGDALHVGGTKHREVHNIYGLMHTKSTHQGLLQRDNGQRRPFILSRSHFAGTQRYSAIWTGDNSADWPYLLASVQECLNANILGIVFCGSDVAGFRQNPNDELFQRWYQAGIWQPFFRAHSDKGTERREPFLKSQEVQDVVRKAIQTRYKHLPLWYTLFYEHVRNKEPIIRPLFYHYPEDVNVYKIDNEMLVGRDILVRTVHEEGAQSVRVYFPGGEEELWVGLEGNEVYTGNGFVDIAVDIQSIPVFYRRGSVIARKEKIRRNSAEMLEDGYTLYVTLDANNSAYGTVYIDDYTSFNYSNALEYNYINVTFEDYNVFTVSDIDTDSSGNFSFVIDEIVYKEITVFPEEKKPGKYIERTVTTTADGTLLKDIKINTKQNTILKL